MFKRLLSRFSNEDDDISEALILSGDCCGLYTFKDELGDKV